MLLASAAMLPGAAKAELPGGVRAMIETAIASGDAEQVATVLDLAAKTHPDDAAEIAAYQSSFAEAEQARQAQAELDKQEEMRSAGIFDNWSGQGEIGAFRSTGNSNNVGGTAGVNLERRGIKWRHKLTALADYQKSDGTTTREQFLGAYEANYQINDRLFAYGLGQYERDRFQGFSSRISTSAGLGYRVIENDSTQLSVKAGPAYRRTSFVGGGSENRLAGLAALDFDWQVAQRVKFTQDASAYIQSGNSSYVSITGVEAGLGGALSARLSYAIEHDTSPPPGAVSTDTLTRFTLIYGF